jgi:nucleoside permease NupC
MEEAPGEELKEAGREAGELVKKMATGLEAVARKVAEADVPKLTRNILTLATGGMTLYLMFTAVSTMAPYAMQAYAQLGVVLGYMIPLMFMIMVFSIAISIVKHLVR